MKARLSSLLRGNVTRKEYKFEIQYVADIDECEWWFTNVEYKGSVMLKSRKIQIGSIRSSKPVVLPLGYPLHRWFVIRH